MAAPYLSTVRRCQASASPANWIYPSRIANNAVRMIDSWIEDLKQQTRSEQSERKYRSIFDHSTQGSFQTTADGRFLTATPAMARIRKDALKSCWPTAS
jgi:PAS domain-containing protein